ncbi:MAG: nucleoside kinase, partial [Defluviitaleaceae bacterium]|nr:nucleoside kinase [Defluviitaleaceae bacterium]
MNLMVNGRKMTIEADSNGLTLEEISRMSASAEPIRYPHLVAQVDNQIMELHKKINKDCEINFLDITTTTGYRVYQRSVVFMMILAAREVLGRHIRVIVEHSINKNYFCEIDKNEKIALTPEIIEKIQQKMEQLVADDLPIQKHSFPIEEGIAVAKEMHLFDKVELLRYRTTSNVNFYKLDWLYDYFYGHMASRCGVLGSFKLKMQDETGFMLIFPNQNKPEEFSELKSLKKISTIFRQSNHWARILKIDTVGALNHMIGSGQRGDIIRVNEALHEKSIANIADEIDKAKKKIIMIAGPSSSGKTTFSHRLCVQLRVIGAKPHTISLDDYYVDREKTPLDKFGKPDFESLYAIDVEQFSHDLKELLAGNTVNMPKFNFISGKREYKGRFLRLDADDVLVIEGIHGLNRELSAGLDPEKIYKIFISALTQLNLDDHNRIPAADTRIIRRMVRDSQFRSF